MNTYEAGYQLAQTDVKRFGSLHALDKADALSGVVEEGYRAGIMEVFSK